MADKDISEFDGGAVRGEASDRVATLTLCRPEQRNVLTGDTLADLAAAIAWVEEVEARACVLRAEGAVFCGGADVRGFVAARESLDERLPGVEARQSMAMTSALSAMSQQVRRCPVPVIAAIDGAAAGAGANLALACDLRIGSPNARFTASFIKVGLTSSGGGTYLWPRVIGIGRALEALMTGRVIEAEEAERIGMLNRLVDAEQVDEAALALARELAALPPLGMRSIKRAANFGMEATLEQALAFEASLQVPLLLTDDHYEGAKAFVEKRPPSFEGR